LCAEQHPALIELSAPASGTEPAVRIYAIEFDAHLALQTGPRAIDHPDLPDRPGAIRVDPAGAHTPLHVGLNGEPLRLASRIHHIEVLDCDVVVQHADLNAVEQAKLGTNRYHIAIAHEAHVLHAKQDGTVSRLSARSHVLRNCRRGLRSRQTTAG